MPPSQVSQVSIYSNIIFRDTLHVGWKSGTAISNNCMYLKFPEGSKPFLSSLKRDVVILFRMTAKLFSSRKEMVGL